MHLSGCVKIDALDLDGLTNLKVLDATSVNLGLVKKDILALHKRRVKVRGFSVRKMMRALRDQAKRRRRRRLCDFCGRQGSIAEPRLPVCYCGRRRYCDENCQRADWEARHSRLCEGTSEYQRILADAGFFREPDPADPDLDEVPDQFGPW